MGGRAHPAKPGEQIRLYVSGVGQTEPALEYRELPRKETEVRVSVEEFHSQNGVSLLTKAADAEREPIQESQPNESPLD